MENYISAILLVVITIAVLTGAIYIIIPRIEHTLPAPYVLNYPSGENVYLAGTTYYVPIKPAVNPNAQPVWICEVGFTFINSGGGVYSGSVSFSYGNPSASTYVYSMGQTVYVSVTNQVIQYPPTEFILSVNPGTTSYTLDAVEVELCPLNSNTPHWSASLEIPPIVLH